MGMGGGNVVPQPVWVLSERMGEYKCLRSGGEGDAAGLKRGSVCVVVFVYSASVACGARLIGL